MGNPILKRGLTYPLRPPNGNGTLFGGKNYLGGFPNWASRFTDLLIDPHMGVS